MMKMGKVKEEGAKAKAEILAIRERSQSQINTDYE
jgi:hypothetical protein